jgi:6-phosphogluconolactonase
MQLRRYPSPKELAHAAAELFCDRARDGFSVALAGGSTPKAMYHLLASHAYRDRVDWNSIDFFWGDERGVPPGHTDSNFRMANDVMLSALDVLPERIHRIEAERDDLDRVAADYEEDILKTLGDPPTFDLVLLGLGTDGHTASLFPHSPALREKKRWVTVNPVGQMGGHRFTLTYPAINRAKEIVFLVSGKKKAEALARVLEGPSDPAELPAQAITGNVHWMVDEDSAGGLSR